MLTIACRSDEAATGERSDRPALALLTSLPLAFGEGFVLDAPLHPAMLRLEQMFTVQLVDGPEQLPVGGLLLAAQPQALTAERLVALDAWVRAGGRILLLADPQLSWKSERPLGDPLRPPFAYPDTGLLQRWGLTLHGPSADLEEDRFVGGREVRARSPGRLVAATGSQCRVSADGFRATCQIGRGRAVVVADADFIQSGVPGGGGTADGNLAALTAELTALTR